MIVPSAEFLGFVAVVAMVLSFSSSGRWRRAIFFIANIAFVLTLSSDPASLAPLLAFVALGFVAIRLTERRRSRAGFVVTLAAVIAAFCWLKRYQFFPHATLLPGDYVTVGMSYIFFRAVSLIVDVRQGVGPERLGVVPYVNYALNFTSLVSGPIQLYRPYEENESRTPAPLDIAVARVALERIATGFFKVIVLSPVLADAHRAAVAAASPLPSLAARSLDGALILALFPLYLYVNFSGYTDVVIGAARFLRLELPENFNRPFSATGYLDFWGRWHMSLSHWFKTYVYSPLLLSWMRRFPARGAESALGVGAYFVTFFLVGLWHGQTLMFVWLGILMGLGTSGNKLFQTAMIGRLGRTSYRTLCATPAYSIASRGLTYAWLAFTLVFFWATGDQMRHIVTGLGIAAIAASFAITLAAAALILAVWTAVENWVAARSAQASPVWTFAVRPAWYATLVTASVSVAAVLDAPAPHIIYRGF